MLRSTCIAALTLLLAVTAAHAERLRGAVKVDGSSTVYPITEAVAEEFFREHRDVRVSVGFSGTGGGFKKFAAGETHISDASRPIKPEERETLAAAGIDFIELPVAYDGLCIVVHPDNDWVDHLSVAELKKIFLDGSGVETWSDVRPGWPDQPIEIYAPGTDSGTFDYFKEVVAGKRGAIRGDMQVSEDDNILVRGVSGERNAIGFFGYAYYIENQSRLRVVPIDGGAGPVTPSPETVESGDYSPFSRPLFIYVSSKAAEEPQVAAFVDFYLDNTADLATEVGYVGLPKGLSLRVERAWNNRQTGTRFLTPAGEKIHKPLAEVFE